MYKRVVLFVCIVLILFMQHLFGADEAFKKPCNTEECQCSYNIDDDLIEDLAKRLKQGDEQKHECKIQQSAQRLALLYVKAHMQKRSINTHGLESELINRVCAEILKKWPIVLAKEHSLFPLFDFHGVAVTALSYNNAGTDLAVGYDNGWVNEYDITALEQESSSFGSLKPKEQYVHGDKRITAACYSPEGRLLSFDGKVIKFWLHKGQMPIELECEPSCPLLAIGCTLQGQIVCAGKNEFKKRRRLIHEANKERDIWDSLKWDKGCNNAYFSADYSHIALHHEGDCMELWSLEKMEKIAQISTSLQIDALCVHNEASVCAYAHTISLNESESCEKGSRITVLNKGKEAKHFKCFDHWKFNQLQLHNDGKKLAGHTRKYLYVFDVDQQHGMNIFEDKEGVTAIAWHPKKLQIAQANQQGKVIVRKFLSPLNSVGSLEQALRLYDVLTQQGLGNCN